MIVATLAFLNLWKTNLFLCFHGWMNRNHLGAYIDNSVGENDNWTSDRHCARITE